MFSATYSRPSNSLSSGYTNGYRYGFNGKESDNEVKGIGNQLDYGFRIYDSRIGKFLSVDPLTKKYPFYSTFQYAGNSPTKFIDLDGLERAEPKSNAGKQNWRSTQKNMVK
jgi:RHS repeat-associated protein